MRKTILLLALMLLGCDTGARLSIVLDVPENIPSLNPAQKQVLQYVRVSVHYPNGVTETRAADFNDKGSFPVGNFPFGDVDKIEVSGYGATGSLVAYGKSTQEGRLSDHGMTVRIPFSFLLAYIPALYRSASLVYTDPFDGMSLLSGTDISHMALLFEPAEPQLPWSRGDTGIAAVTISKSGKYGAVVLTNISQAVDFIGKNGNAPDFIQWIAVFDTSSYRIIVPDRVVQVKAGLIRRLEFSDDDNMLLLVSDPTGQPGSRTVTVGMVSIPALMERSKEHPQSPYMVSTISVEDLEVVRDVSIHDEEVVILGNTAPFVWSGPTMEDSEPVAMSDSMDVVPGNLFTVCDLMAGALIPNVKDVRTKLIRFKYTVEKTKVTIKGMQVYSNMPDTGADELRMGEGGVLYLTSLAWIPEIGRYRAVQPCGGGPQNASNFYELNVVDQGVVVTAKSYTFEGGSVKPFRVVYHDGEIITAGLATRADDAQQDSRWVIKIGKVSMIGNEIPKGTELINYPYGNVDVQEQQGDISLTLFLPPTVAFPVDFRLAPDGSRYLMVMNEYFLARDIGFSEVEDFYYTTSTLVVGGPGMEEPMRTVRLYCHSGTGTESVDTCSKPYGAYTLINETDGPSEGYPPAAIGFMYGVK